MRVAGKVAIITGAASGIGRATAIRFGEEGARVVVADINRNGGKETVATITSVGGDATFIEADVGDEAALEQMVDFKGGVMSLTRALALELAPTIRVVAVLPGAINTPAVQISEDEGLVDSIIATVPLRRLGEPEEIANTVLFLASDEAPYITGTGILVDGGYTAQ